MTALDFFLYDNWTWSPRWGRDWGVKAATGALAERADLLAAFDSYCGATPSEQGQLSGFGQALGGVRSPAERGYLLCVTLESTDSYGRPSWAIFGLWCPDRETLEAVLSAGDPVASARALLDRERLPGVVEIQPARAMLHPLRRKPATVPPAFRRFDPKSSVREVTAILLGALRARIPLPSVLGVTATSRFAAVAREGFDLVYCHPLDERAEQALARLPSSPEAEDPEEQPRELPAERMTPEAPASARPWRGRSAYAPGRTFAISSWILLLAVAILGGLVSLVVIDLWRHATDKTLMHVEEDAGELAVFEDVPIPETASEEAVLAEVKERLEEFRELAPQDLQGSPGYRVAESVPVIPKHEERRQRVRDAYSGLLGIRDRMVKPPGNYVAYFFEEEGARTPSSTRFQKIAEILAEAPLGGEQCAVLEEAFGFEFETPGSALRRWCDAAIKLEETARRLPLAPGTRGPSAHGASDASTKRRLVEGGLGDSVE